MEPGRERVNEADGGRKSEKAGRPPRLREAYRQAQGRKRRRPQRQARAAARHLSPLALRSGAGAVEPHAKPFLRTATTEDVLLDRNRFDPLFGLPSLNSVVDSLDELSYSQRRVPRDGARGSLL